MINGQLVKKFSTMYGTRGLNATFRRLKKTNNYLTFKLKMSERIFVSSKVNEILIKLCLLVCSYTDEDCKFFYVFRIVHVLIINILCNK